MYLDYHMQEYWYGCIIDLSIAHLSLQKEHPAVWMKYLVCIQWQRVIFYCCREHNYTYSGGDL
jgi:hypothetical protein